MDLFDLFAKIELDTSDYESGIATVESGAGDAESAIGGIGSASDNADGQLDNLGSQASNTGADLDNLGGDADNAGSDIDSMGGEASGAAGDLDSLQSMASSTSGMLDSLGGSAGGASGELGGLGDEMSGNLTAGGDSASTSLGGVSDLLGAFATGGIVAGAVAAVGEVSTAFYDLALEAENSRVTIAQGTGATGDELDSFSESAQTALGNVSLASQTNLGDVSGVLAELNTRFGITDEELENTTTTMTDFATVTGQSGVQAVDDIADAMSYWGLDLEDMPGLLDNIVTAEQGTKATAQEYEQALYNNAGAFDSLGYSVDDALAFLATYSANGGNVADVTTMLRTAVQKLSTTTDDVPGSFQAAIDAIGECDTVAEALNTQVGDTGLTVEDVFGSRNAQKLATNILTGQTSIEDWTSALEDNQGALEQTVEDSTTMQDSISGSMQRIKSDVSEIFTPAVETVVSGAADMLDGVISFAEDTGTKLSEWNENATEWLYNQFGTTTEGAIESVHNLADTIDEKFEAAGETIQGWGESVGEKLGSLKDDVGSFATEFGEKATEAASTFIDNIGSGISGGIETVKGKAQELGENVSGKVKSFFGIGGEGDMEKEGEEIDQGLANGISNSSGEAESEMEAESSRVLNSIKSFFGINSPSTVMEDQGEYMTEGVVLGFDQLADDVTAKFQDMADMIWDWSGKEITTMQQTGVMLKGAFTTGMKDLPDDIQIDALDPANKTIEEWGSKVGRSASDYSKKFTENFISGVKSFPSDFSKLLDEVMTTLTNWSDSLTKKSTETASNFLKNWQSGIKSMPSDTKSVLDNVTTKVTDFSDKLNTKMETAGEKAVKNFTSGMNSQASAAKEKASDIAEKVLNKFDITDKMEKYGTKDASSFKSGLSSGGSDIKSKASDIASGVLDKFNIKDSMNTRGYNAGIGFNNGLASTSNTILNTASNLASNVVGRFNFYLQIGSPSKVLYKTGENTGEGFALGLESTEDEIEDIVDDITDIVAGADFYGALNDSLEDISGNVNVSSYASGSSGETESGSVNELINLLEEYLPQLAQLKVVLDTGTLVGEIAEPMDRQLGNLQTRRGRMSA